MRLLGPWAHSEADRSAQAANAWAGYPKIMENKTMKKALLAVLMLVPGLCFAERYSLRDGGDFAPVGYRVEFADRYGWRSYTVDFDFGLENGSRTLSKDSKLTLKIARRDGSTWTYTCKSKGKDNIYANINFLYGKGISVVAECRIPEKTFAKAVDLDPQDVGQPNFVFQAMIQDGEVRPGAQRGLYFLPGGQLEASELNAYAGANDPTNLAVLFRSN